MSKGFWRQTRRSATRSCLRQKKGVPSSAKPKAERVRTFVVADGRGVVLAFRVARGSPTEGALIDPTLEHVAVPRSGPGRPRWQPRRRICNKAGETDPPRLWLKKGGIESISTHRSNSETPTLPDGRLLRRNRCPLALDRPKTGLGHLLRWSTGTRASPRC